MRIIAFENFLQVVDHLQRELNQLEEFCSSFPDEFVWIHHILFDDTM